jgi:DNA-binding transcriptional regulator GbsR (MarR family)
MKRLIKPRRKIEPFEKYQEDDYFIVERNGIQEFRSQYLERCNLYIQMKLAQMRKEDEKINQDKEKNRALQSVSTRRLFRG